MKAEGPLAKAPETFRALYLLETEGRRRRLRARRRIPAAGTDGAVEVWPLIER